MFGMKKVVKIGGVLGALLMCAVITPKVINTPVARAAGDVEINETNFPDEKMRKAVKKKDTDSDGKLSESEIEEVKYLCVWYCSNLKGIEFFTSITKLELVAGKMTSFDLSKNTKLRSLICYECNNLSSVDLSKQTNLKELDINCSKLTALDLSKNTKLEKLDCSYNHSLTSVDVSKCSNLAELELDGNNLLSLDVSNNPNLIKLYCRKNPQLSSLKVGQSTFLIYMGCQNCNLSSLNVSQLTALDYLDCSSNKLTALDLSKNTALTTLYCRSNKLSSLDISKCTKMEELYCEYNTISSLDLSRLTALTYLGCGSNNLSSLNLSKSTALRELNCSSNKLSSLDLSKNTALRGLNCSSNKLSSLDLSKNTALQGLNCKSNNLSSLDVSNNTELQGLCCSFNKLSSLNISKNKSLFDLYCYGNNIQSLIIKNCPELVETFTTGSKETKSDNGYAYLSYERLVAVSDVDDLYDYLMVDKFVNVWPVTPLTKPQNLKASYASDTSIKVSWSKVEGATGYQVWRSTSANGTYSCLGTVTTTSKTSTSLKKDTTYYYKVRAYYEVNNTKSFTDYSSVVSATTTKITAPANVKATSASASSVKITWSAVSGAEGYEVFRSTSASGSFVCLGWVSGTSKTSTGLTAGTTYYYKVRAFKTVNGNKVYSEYSAVVNAIPKPSKPTNIKLSVTNPTTVKISWTAPADAEYVQIWRASKANAAQSDYSLIQTCEKSTTSTKSNYLTPNKTYYYKLRSYVINGSGTRVYSPFSSVYSITPSVTVGVPTGLKVSSTTSNSITLTWNAVSGSNIRYEVLRKEGSSEVVVDRMKNTTITDTGLTSKTTYSYRIRAYFYYTDSNGNGQRIYGDYTSTVKGTTK